MYKEGDFVVQDAGSTFHDVVSMKTGGCNVLRRVSITRVLVVILIIMALMIIPVSMETHPPHKWNTQNHSSSKATITSRTVFDNGTEMKLLEATTNYLVFGGRNALYNVSVTADGVGQLVKVLDWNPSEAVRKQCTNSGKKEDDCQNYISLYIKDNEAPYAYVCGSNAFNPMCRRYWLEKPHSWIKEEEYSGRGLAPYDPKTSAKYTYIAEGEAIIAGTFADFSQTDPLIYRQCTNGSVWLRTEPSDNKCLNEPVFISTLADKDMVYFWFYEEATESETAKYGKFVNSRVAKVCRRDIGGPGRHRHTWTTFQKARLDCSFSGKYPFQFHKLVSAVKWKDSTDNSELVFAIFDTEYNSMRAAAVCVYKLSDVRNIFENGALLLDSAKQSSFYYWPSDNQQIRPGQCVNNSRQLPDEAVAFVSKNVLMKEPIINWFSEPVFSVTSEFGDKFGFLSTLAIDHVQLTDGRFITVMFLGTTNGTVVKAIFTLARQNTSATIIDSFKASEHSIDSLIVNKQDEVSKHQLIAISGRDVSTVDLNKCDIRTSCEDCISSRDPYCAWNTLLERCESHNYTGTVDHNLIQDVEYGNTSKCSAGPNDTAWISQQGVTETPTELHPLSPANQEANPDQEGLKEGEETKNPAIHEKRAVNNRAGAHSNASKGSIGQPILICVAVVAGLLLVSLILACVVIHSLRRRLRRKCLHKDLYGLEYDEPPSRRSFSSQKTQTTTDSGITFDENGSQATTPDQEQPQSSISTPARGVPVTCKELPSPTESYKSYVSATDSNEASLDSPFLPKTPTSVSGQ